MSFATRRPLILCNVIIHKQKKKVIPMLKRNHGRKQPMEWNLINVTIQIT